MIADPRAIDRILKDDRFAVNIPKFGDIAERAGVKLPHQKMLHAYLPVALEGADHAALRPMFDQEISGNTKRALAVFEEGFAASLLAVASPGGPKRFCVVRDLLKPSIRAGNMAIAGIENCDVDDLESVPLFFDKGLSLKKRRHIEVLMDRVLRSLPEAMPISEKYFRLAIIGLNMNTALGAISESVGVVLARNRGAKLKDMDWDLELPATALPVMERKAAADLAIDGNTIRAGDRVQLFLDVDGFDRDRGPKYSELYFAAGPHKCPGMNYSRRVWTIVTRYLKAVDARWDIVSVAYRPNDVNFDLLETLEVECHA